MPAWLARGWYPSAMAKTLVLGGIRSGKSDLAERLVAAAGGPVCYVATATAGDDEMAARIRAHQARRPADWGLVEEPRALGRVLADNPASALLIDCMSLWLSNLLGAGEETLAAERAAFLGAVAAHPADVVIVSNEVGLGLIGMDALSRRFADELGWLNQALATRCDNVILTVAGLPWALKGQAPDPG